MVRFRSFHLPHLDCKAVEVVLAWAFVIGLLVGCLASSGCRILLKKSNNSLAPCAGISVFVPTVVPLLFSGFVVYIRKPLLLIPIAFWKSLFLSCVGTGIVLTWGCAGWLVGGFALFGSICALPVLWYYWLRHIRGEPFSFRLFALALSAMILIGWIDFLVISPFLMKILTF